MERREEGLVMTEMAARRRRTGAFFPFAKATHELVEGDNRGGAVSGTVDC